MAKVKKEKNVKEQKQKSHYFKDMKAELKKVIWPSSKQTINNTIAVIVFTLVAALIVFILDLCFDSINKYAITPLQDKIQSSYEASNSEAEQQNVENTEANTEANDTEIQNTEAEETDATNIEVENQTSEAENTESVEE